MYEDFRSLVQRLFTDGDLRQRFLSKPEDVLNDAPLSVEERRALLRLHTRLAAAGGSNTTMQVGTLGYWP